MKFAQSLLLLVLVATSFNGCALWGNRQSADSRHGNRKFQDTLVTRRALFGPHQYDHEGYWTRTLESEEYTDRGRPKEERIARQEYRDRVWAPPRTPMP